MKRMIMAIAAAVMMGSAAMAQSGDSVKQVKKMDRTELVKRQTEHMAKKYGLSEEQKAKLLELNTKYGAARMMPQHAERRRPVGGGDSAVKARPAAGDSLKFVRKPGVAGHKMRGGASGDMQARYEEGLKAIMTPEQYQQYTEDKKKRPQREGGPKGNRPQKPAEGGSAE